MTPRLELNFDIWEIIADILDDANEARKGLETLSLTCKPMVPLCRKHLFSKLYLNCDLKSNPCHRFKNLITDNPDIILFVRQLHYSLNEPLHVDCHHVLEMLKDRSVGLTSIRLWRGGNNWNTYPQLVQALLDHLVHTPSVTTLKLAHITGIPTTLFTGCSHLTNISLEKVDFTCPDTPVLCHADGKPRHPRPVFLRAGWGSSNAIRTLMEQQGTNNNQRVVDFSDLKAVHFEITRMPQHMEAIRHVLQIATSLDSLELLTYEDFQQWTGLGATLTSTRAISNLRKLTLDRHLYNGDQDPLCGLTEELKVLAHINRLEEIKLSLSFSTDEGFRPDTEDWALFDVLMTQEGLFPRLRAVSVEIFWFSFGDAGDYAGMVQKEDFPMLVNSTAIEFIFSMEHEYVPDYDLYYREMY